MFQKVEESKLTLLSESVHSLSCPSQESLSGLEDIARQALPLVELLPDFKEKDMAIGLLQTTLKEILPEAQKILAAQGKDAAFVNFAFASNCVDAALLLATGKLN